MKLLQSTLLAASGAAAFSPQQVLQAPHKTFTSWSKPLDDLQSSLKSLSREGRAIWDEVALLFPEAIGKTTFFSSPKKHTRRPASQWDSIIHGADVQKIWTENADGEMERDIDGKLEAYTLKSRAVDPSVLGVDPGVKQISGYLDDNDNDKHLFYWFFESRGNPETDPVSSNLVGACAWSTSTNSSADRALAQWWSRLLFHGRPFLRVRTVSYQPEA